MIARFLVFMRALLRRRPAPAPASRGPWAVLENYRRRPPESATWISAGGWQIREATVDEMREDPRAPVPARRRWLDRRG